MKYFECLIAVHASLQYYNSEHLQTLNVQVYEHAQYIMYMLTSLQIITRKHDSAVDYECLLNCVYDEIICIEMHVDCLITKHIMQDILLQISAVVD